MLYSTCVDSIIEELKLLECDLATDIFTAVDRYGIKILKQELGIVRTFLLCARKWVNHETLGTSLLNFEDSVRRNVGYYFYSLCLGLEDGILSDNSANVISGFRQVICSCSQEIKQLYICLLDCIQLQSSSCSSDAVSSDDLMEFLDSLQQNLMDLLVWSKSHFDDSAKIFQKVIKHLQEKLICMRDFIRFAVFRGVDDTQMEYLLIDSEVLAVNAASLCGIWWFERYDEEVWSEAELEISELVQKIKPAGPYIQLLNTVSKLSGSKTQSLHTLTLEKDKHILGDFLDSLLGILRDLLNSGNSFMDLVDDEIQILYMVVRFLRTILQKQQEKFNDLDENTKDLTGVVINDVAIIICSLYVNKEENVWEEEMYLALLDVLDKIKLIKAEVEEKHPVTSITSFPKSNQLGIMDFLLENLKALSRYVDDSVTIVNNTVQKIQEDLGYLSSSLESIVEKGNLHEKLQILWRRVMDEVCKAEFVIHSLKVGVLTDYFASLLTDITEEVKVIKTQILEIDDNKYDFESQRATKTWNQTISQRCIQATNEAVVGFVDEANTIIDRLTRGTKQLDIVSIVGMPGIGKTTLAKKVYTDPSVRCYFHIFAWSCVSQAYDKKRLFLEILVCFDPKCSNQYTEMNEDDLAERLYRCLKGNKYLIILDDIWDVEAWNGLKRSFPDDAIGSRILLTSRLSKVAFRVRPEGELHYLRRLSDDESWELLQNKLLARECYPPEVCAIGKQIAKSCGGLPLTIIVVAGILATSEQNSWKEVAKSLNTNTICNTEHCMNTLEMSYKHLPDYLKPCLLYFGAFVPDKEIPSWKLLRLWIAEGFVKKTVLKSLEDAAVDYMMDLVDRNLVMVAKQRSIGGVKTCCIHDLIHEFCVAKAKEENFLQLLHEDDELFTLNLGNLSRMCLYSIPRNFTISRLFFHGVRSLLIFANDGIYRHGLIDISFVFRIFKVLRVLDLTKISLGNSFPSEITSLVRLRYLAVQVGKLKFLPSSIAHLQKLETLLVRAFGWTSITMPYTVWKMKRLKHLHVTGSDFHFSLAEEDQGTSSDLSHLETVSSAYLSFEKMEMLLRKFPDIRSIKCRSFLWTESKGILSMDLPSRLESLKLSLRDSQKYPNEFRFPLSLRKLTLLHLPMSPLISTIGKLPNLEVLKLENVAFASQAWEMTEEGDFLKLRILKLKHLRIVRWTGSGDFFPCLQKLVLLNCQRLDEFPSCLGCSSTLEMIEVRDCPKSVSNLVQEVEEEQRSMGNEDFKTVILEEC